VPAKARLATATVCCSIMVCPRPKRARDCRAARQAVEAAGGAPEPPPARGADWAEGVEGAAAARGAGELGLLTATEPLARAFLGWRPPSVQQACTLLHPIRACAAGAGGATGGGARGGRGRRAARPPLPPSSQTAMFMCSCRWRAGRRGVRRAPVRVCAGCTSLWCPGLRNKPACAGGALGGGARGGRRRARGPAGPRGRAAGARPAAAAGCSRARAAGGCRRRAVRTGGRGCAPAAAARRTRSSGGERARGGVCDAASAPALSERRPAGPCCSEWAASQSSEPSRPRQRPGATAPGPARAGCGAWAAPLGEWAALDTAGRLRRLAAAPGAAAPSLPPPPSAAPMQPLRAALATVLRSLPARERDVAAAALLAERAAAAPGLAWAAALVAAEAQQLQARPASAECMAHGQWRLPCVLACLPLLCGRKGGQWTRRGGRHAAPASVSSVAALHCCRAVENVAALRCCRAVEKVMGYCACRRAPALHGRRVKQNTCMLF